MAFTLVQTRVNRHKYVLYMAMRLNTDGALFSCLSSFVSVANT